MPVSALVKPVREELRRVDQELARLTEEKAALVAILELAGGGRNGSKASTRKRDRTGEKTVSAEKAAELDAYLRRTIPTGQLFTSDDLEGWEGFQALGINRTRLTGALGQLAREGHIRQADRGAYQGELAGPRTKVWQVVA